MDALEQFLTNHADEPSMDEIESDLDDNEFSDNEPNELPSEEVTFGDKLGYNEEEILNELRSSKRFEKTLENRYYNSMSNKNHNAQAANNDHLLSHRIHSYKYKKAEKSTKNAPVETKIHKTPLSFRAISREKNSKEPKFVSRDPRFGENESSQRNESGWKLRKAYHFLDDMIDRDINIIEKQIQENKKQIKDTKKRSTEYSKETNIEIRQKGAAVGALKNELIALRNRKNRIQERDLEQKSKSQMRKMEIDQVSRGIKTPYHHKLKRNRFGQVKWAKSKGDNANGAKPNVSIQNVYLQNKYDRLKQDGKLEKYMKNKTKRINKKFRVALKKKSGRGWNDTV